MATYQSKKVTVVGDVKQGDSGFDAAKPKLKIKHQDGREETVAKDQVQDTGAE
jgi:hypothetical protein